jgi:16S rRNA (guanine966-N2)-methyltransferase
MRIIAGSARGRRLASVPKQLVIRPTLDRVREALFSALGPRLPGAAFLDLFAGTGANGLEALSRGAEKAVFVDSHPDALALIRENLARTRLEGRGKSHCLSMPKGLARLEGVFDIIYADPPQTFADYVGFLSALESRKLLAEGGVIVLEHGTGLDLPATLGAWYRTRQRSYGKTTVSSYLRK